MPGKAFGRFTELLRWIVHVHVCMYIAFCIFPSLSSYIILFASRIVWYIPQDLGTTSHWFLQCLPNPLIAQNKHQSWHLFSGAEMRCRRAIRSIYLQKPTFRNRSINYSKPRKDLSSNLDLIRPPGVGIDSARPTTSIVLESKLFWHDLATTIELALSSHRVPPSSPSQDK